MLGVRLRMRRSLALIGLVIAVVGLSAQFAASIPMFIAAGKSPSGALIAILSYFTVLTNIAVGLVYAAALAGSPAFLINRRVRDALLVPILVVGSVYHAVLAQLWAPTGLMYFADLVLHTLAPAWYLVWWLFAGRSSRSSLADLPEWMLYPSAYLAYALLRGAMTGEYPYPFLDLGTNDTASVALSVGIIIGLFAVLGAFVVMADRLLPKLLPVQD